MTVRDLVERLEQFDDDTLVHFAYDYGDHCHTEVAPAVESVEEELVYHSDYLNKDAVVEDEDMPPRKNVRTVVVLR